MSDLFAPLREPEPASALAPESVRRRGDRLRRRRAGLTLMGAVVAAAIVVGGSSLVVGDRPRSDSPSRPVDSPHGKAVFPAQLDLADGLPRGTVSSAGSPSLVICGEPFSLADGATASEEVGQAERGDFTTRGLSVYPDAGAARSVATRLVAAYEDCPRFTDRRGRAWTTSVRPTAYGDQGWVVSQLVTASGPRVDFPEVTQVVRLGVNLLVTQQREIHGLRLDVMTRFTSDQVAGLMHRQMCLLTEEGCTWRSDPDVLRPDGWGPFRLGMSREEVEATGVAGFSDAGDCTAVDLGPGQGWLTETDGLVSIQVPEGVTTPDGVGAGASRDEVLESYPMAEGKDVMLVRASPTADYKIKTERDQVTQLTLTNVGDECSG